MKEIKHHRFTRFTFLAGFIWALVLIGVCWVDHSSGRYGGYNDELFPLFIPPLFLMLPTLYHFFIGSTSAEVIPGFVGLYFKRRRLQEEARIAEILPEGKAPLETTDVSQMKCPESSGDLAETRNDNKIEDDDEKGFSRLPYIILFVVVGFFVSVLPEMVPVNENNVWFFIIPLIGIIHAVVFYRLQNIGYRNPGLLTLLGYVPIVNLYFAYACLAFPKDYAVTKKMDPTGRLLGLLFILFWIFAIIAMAIPAIQYANQAR